MKTDLNYLKTMSGGSAELISEMIEIFKEQVFAFSSEMQQLLNNKEYEALGLLAHKAKTSVSIMGMNELSIRLKELENSAKSSKNIHTYQDIITFFQSECEEAVAELNEFKNQLS